MADTIWRGWADQADAPFMLGFVDVAKDVCFKNLKGIVTAELELLKFAETWNGFKALRLPLATQHLSGYSAAGHVSRLIRLDLGVPALWV